ncbi:MAG: ribosome silencing factor [Planctomycetota bacterium]|nr:ribosome silencing factor [Planctomycetota bacterium]
MTCARIADEKKGENIVVLDMRKVFFLTDYFVLCSGLNPKHLQTIADEIRAQMKAKHAAALGREGYEAGAWILIDYGDFVIHVLQDKLRRYYELDHLWADASQVKWQKRAPAKRKQAAQRPS